MELILQKGPASFRTPPLTHRLRVPSLPAEENPASEAQPEELSYVCPVVPHVAISSTDDERQDVEQGEDTEDALVDGPRKPSLDESLAHEVSHAPHPTKKAWEIIVCPAHVVEQDLKLVSKTILEDELEDQEQNRSEALEGGERNFRPGARATV